MMIHQILNFFKLSGRKLKRGKSWCHYSKESLVTLSVFVVVWTVCLYRCQRYVILQRILHVLGEDRNTSEKLIPGRSTTLIQPSHSCQALQREARRHGDLIVEDLDDHYYALTVKTLHTLKWFTIHCSRSKFLVKTDDDVYVNLPVLLTQLRDIETSRTFTLGGLLHSGRSPNSFNVFSKWYTPPELLSTSVSSISTEWPSSYLGGPFYVMRGDLVGQLLKASLQLPLIHLEDVFLSGMVAEGQLGYGLKDLEGTFDPRWPILWYLTNKYLKNWNFDLLSSFHTDGNDWLIRWIFTELERRE